MSYLTPCTYCGCHVRASEERCPFCQKSFSAKPENTPDPWSLFDGPDIRISPRAFTSVSAVYGAPPIPDQEDSNPSTTNPPEDNVHPVQFREENTGEPAYRAPAMTADEDRRSAPKYGAPPLRDALPPPDLNDLRPAPKYGGPPLRRITTSLIFVGGVAIVVYLLIWR